VESEFGDKIGSGVRAEGPRAIARRDRAIYPRTSLPQRFYVGPWVQTVFRAPRNCRSLTLGVERFSMKSTVSLAAGALALAVAVLTFALERRLGYRELRTAAASVLLSLVPWATAAK
jgi:hypothetical protein